MHAADGRRGCAGARTGCRRRCGTSARAPCSSRAGRPAPPSRCTRRRPRCTSATTTPSRPACCSSSSACMTPPASCRRAPHFASAPAPATHACPFTPAPPTWISRVSSHPGFVGAVPQQFDSPKMSETLYYWAKHIPILLFSTYPRITLGAGETKPAMSRRTLPSTRGCTRTCILSQTNRTGAGRAGTGRENHFLACWWRPFRWRQGQTATSQHFFSSVLMWTGHAFLSLVTRHASVSLHVDLMSSSICAKSL